MDRLRTEREQTDMHEFMRMLEVYGPDTLLTWWKNGTAILYGHTAPSPGRISDPRRG